MTKPAAPGEGDLGAQKSIDRGSSNTVTRPALDRSNEDVLVLVPTYDERENLPLLLEAVQSSLPGAHILVIDDASPDGTGRLADELARRLDGVHVRHRASKLGLGTAYLEGFRHALEGGYGFVFEMDCDFSHDPADLGRLLSPCRVGDADITIGSRYVRGGSTEGWSLVRRLVSRGGGAYSRVVLGMGVRDLTSGFKCFTRRALEQIPLHRVRSEGFAFQIEVSYLAHRAGLRILEVPIRFRDRVRGESKMSGAIFLEALSRVWKIRLGR